MSNEAEPTINSIEWRDDHVRIIDQTYLPKRKVYSDIRDLGRMWEAIKNMRISGAPAVGIAAGYGFYLGIQELTESSFNSFWVEVERVHEYLKGARPGTANLDWVVNRIKKTMQAHKDKPIADIKAVALKTAKTIHDEDKRTCKKIGEMGADLIEDDSTIITHASTGGLATGQHGTALSVIVHASRSGRDVEIRISETRPMMQGARLAAWELKNADIPFKIVIDAAAGYLMQQCEVDAVIVGADCVAANGDTIAKIGTYPLAVLAKQHDIPFYVALPTSTIDRSIETGQEVKIEHREGAEITEFNGSHIAPQKAEALNPVTDRTPHDLVTAFITEKGVIHPPFQQAFADHMQG